MSHQYNQTGDFGQAVYGPASGPQHIASAPAPAAVMAGGKRRSRSDKKRSEKKQRGGKSRSRNQRKSRRDRRSRRQRGGK